MRRRWMAFSPPTTRPLSKAGTARSSSGARPMRCISRSAFWLAQSAADAVLSATTLWYIVLKVPEGSRINYQLEVRRGEHVERFNDPLKPQALTVPSVPLLSALRTATSHPRGPFQMRATPAESSTHRGQPSITARLSGDHLSAGRFRHDKSFPLLVVHDGGDFLQYSAAKVVLDNHLPS